MLREFLRILALLAVVAAGLTFGTSTADSLEAVPVIVGAPLPLSGRLAPFGAMMKNAMEMAQQRINAAGGVRGQPLRLLFADDRGEVSRALTVVRELDQAGAVMLVGGYQSNVTFALARFAQQRDLPFLVSTAATDRITRQHWANIFRLNPPLSEYPLGLQELLLKELHPKSIAIIHENSLFGTDAAADMMSFMMDNGIEIRDLLGYPRGQASPAYFRSLLAPLTRHPPDIIHMISYFEDGAALIRTIRELEIPSRLSGGAAGFTVPELLSRAGEAAEGMLVASLWSEQLPYPGARAFFDDYLARYATAPDYHGAEAYSALLVAASALEAAGSSRPEAIRGALEQTFMATPFGPVKFYAYDGFHRQNSLRTLVLQVQNGAFRIVWPPDLSTARLDAP